MNICNKIIALRDRAGLSQEEVAKKIEMSKSSYCRKEKGDSKFTIEEFIKLLRLFNVTYSDFVEMDFPIVYEERISKDLLDKLEKVTNECKEVSSDWNTNREYFNRIQSALYPVFDERKRSFDIPDYIEDYKLTGSSLKKVLLDPRAEYLIERAISVQNQLTHVLFGAETRVGV